MGQPDENSTDPIEGLRQEVEGHLPEWLEAIGAIERILSPESRQRLMEALKTAPDETFVMLQEHLAAAQAHVGQVRIGERSIEPDPKKTQDFLNEVITSVNGENETE